MLIISRWGLWRIILPLASIKTFEQADYTDCNDVNTFPKIYFWQYDDLLLDNNFIQSDILTNNYFINKQFDT